HIHSDDVPYVTFRSGVKTRILHASADAEFVVTQGLSPAGTVSELHRHSGPVFGWTNRGSWGHDLNFEYTPGTYIYEIPMAPHRFYGGPEEIDAIFVTFGSFESLDEETGEVIGVATNADLVRGYFEACE